MPSKVPLITTIIPTYRRPEMLKKAVRSALDQTYSNIQICVYDNASGDDTKQIVADFIKHDSRVKYHCHPENIGMMGNYAYAFREVVTDYFSFLSDDDVLLPCFYETALENFETFPQIGFSACSITIITPEGKPLRTPLAKWKIEGYYPAPLGMYEMIGKYPIPNGVLFHKKIKEKIQEIDLQNPIVWDCDFLLHVAGLYPIAISKKPCGFFLAHETSFSVSTDSEKFRLGFLRIMERIKKNTQFPHEIIKTAEQKLKKSLARDAFFDGLKNLLQRNFPYAFKTLHFLKTENAPFRAFLLYLSINICRFLPFTFGILFLIYRIRRIFKEKIAYSEAANNL